MGEGRHYLEPATLTDVAGPQGRLSDPHCAKMTSSGHEKGIDRACGHAVCPCPVPPQGHSCRRSRRRSRESPWATRPHPAQGAREAPPRRRTNELPAAPSRQGHQDGVALPASAPGAARQEVTPGAAPSPPLPSPPRRNAAPCIAEPASLPRPRAPAAHVTSRHRAPTPRKPFVPHGPPFPPYSVPSAPARHAWALEGDCGEN